VSIAGKVAVVGLDCGTPRLMFDELAADMPNFSAFTAQALWGPLRSTAPPITVPAWSCMFAGRSPGELGIYGFRNRNGHGYDALSVATSRDVRVPRLWDLVDRAGGECLLLGVPGTYPAPAVSGRVVTDFLTPPGAADWATPPALGHEIHDLVGDYMFDVFDFRTDDKARVAQQVFDLTEQRFDVARHLVTSSSDWDLFAMVDMGPDRLHHGFWATYDEGHPRHDPDGPHHHLFRDYYRMLDAKLGLLLDTFDDDTAVLVVSDHGAQPMLGGFCINEWLVQQGLLCTSSEITARTPIAEAPVDWARTVAWADGGYYARVFLNVAGREPLGAVSLQDYEEMRQLIIDALEAMPDHRGVPMGNRAFRPEELYPEVNGVAPDLIVYLGDLRWRSVGTLGLGDGLYTFRNDTGPDDANHAELGVFALRGDGLPTGFVDDLSIYDVAPTLQSLMALDAPAHQSGLVRA
jgi:predicted AlkP superfamily phosphohydrolase/phosphomutase